MVGFLRSSQWLGRKWSSIQGLSWVTGKALPASIPLEFSLLGWTQRGKGQGYFDLSHQWGICPFEGLLCTSRMSQTSDDLNDLVVYTTMD